MYSLLFSLVWNKVRSACHTEIKKNILDIKHIILNKLGFSVFNF